MADDVDFGVADYLANPNEPVGPRLKDSLLYGVQQTPDVQAKVRSYARSLNISLPAALDDKEYVQQQGRVQEIDPNGMVLGAPKTANWLSQPDNAAVAHDDIDVLKSIEDTVGNLGKLTKSAGYSLVNGSIGYLQAISPILKGVGIDLGNEKDNGVGEYLTFLRKATKQESDKNLPQTDNPWAAGVNAGITSFIQNAPTMAAAVLTKNPALGLMGAAALQGGQSYGDARDAGHSRGASAGFAGVMGGIEAATEKLPMDALVGDYIKHSGILNTFFHQLVTDVPGEQVATLTQDFAEWAFLHPDKPFSDYLASRPDAAISTLVASGVGSAGHATLNQVAQSVAQRLDPARQHVAQAQEAPQVGEVLANLEKAAQASALRQRDPQTFKEYVDAVTEESPTDRVYINANDLVDVLSQGSPEKLGENAAVLQAMPSVMPQLDDAVKSGGLVEIPLSELLAFTPDTTLGQSLIEHLKVDPNAMSMKEAEAFMQTQAEGLKADVEKAVEAGGQVEEFAKSAEAVRVNIDQQLQAANRFTPDVNAAYASLVSSFYATQATRLGVTPEALFAQHPLTIKAQGVQPDSLTDELGQGAPETPAYEPGLGFRSSLFDTLAKTGQPKASADQWLATLQNAPGVKKDELEWLGLGDALKEMGKDGPVTKGQVMAYIAQNGVRLSEVQLGGPQRAAGYDGAEHFAEFDDDRGMWIVYGPEAEDGAFFPNEDEAVHHAAVLNSPSGFAGPAQYGNYQAIKGGENYREVLVTLPSDDNTRLQRDFTASMGHWDHDNVLAHTRLADFTTPDGKRVLGVLEVQSDWHQKGRDMGYTAPVTAEERAAAAQAYEDATKAWEIAGQDLVDTATDLDLLPAIAFGAAFERLGLHERWRAASDALDKAAHTDLHVRVLERINEARKAWADAGLARSEASQAVSQLSRGIPDAPFKATWPALVMRRVLRMAVEEGYDAVAWATGEQQADLYDMREHIDTLGATVASDMPDNDRIAVNIPRLGGRTQELAAQGIGEYRASDNTVLVTRDQAASLLGAELGHRIYDETMAKRVLREDGYYDLPDYRVFTGADLTVGGEGHKAFYNRNLVNIVNGIIKKYGGKVGEIKLATATDADRVRMADNRAALNQETDPDMRARYERRLAADAGRMEGSNQPGFQITNNMREAVAASQQPLFQGDGAATARGAFNPSTNTIVLLKNADLSTFLHETGHFYLETLARMAAAEGSPEGLRDDWAKAAGFMGFGGMDPAGWLALPVDARRDGHETWARAFEAYLREGKAPSPSLQNLFRRFKSWLLHVYQSLTELKVELTDEVRGIFDRLIASDEEIARAEASRFMTPVFDEKPDGMTDQEWQSYQRLGAEATETATEELAARSIRDMRWTQNQRARIVRQLGREAREKRQAVKAEVESEVLAEPVYAAQQYLRRGVLQGEPVEGSHKLDIEAVAANYEGVAPELQDWRKLGFGRYGMLANDGLNPDHVAELFGFSSGHELTEALINAEPMADKIAGMTDQRMLERYGDLTDEAAIQKAADEAIHNDARLRFVATEANALAKAAGSTRVLAEAARDFAKELVGRQRIRDVRPGKYTGAEARAAATAARAAAKGDLVQAAQEKRNQLINGYAAKAAYEAQSDVEKALRYFDRLQSAAARKGMDTDYREQIDALLERFDLRKGESLKAVDRRKSLKSWIEAMQARGLDPIIDGDLADAAYRKHYKDMSVDEMRGLVDAVKNIAHLGRLKNRLLVAAKGRAFQAVVDEAEALIRERAYKTIPEKVEHNMVRDRVLSGFANFFAIHRKFASLIREMSGLKEEGGVLWSAFIRPMNEANDKEAAMRERATVALADVFKTLTTKKDELRKKLFIPALGRSLSLEGRLAVALNWGNELNRARIMDGDKWSADQVTAILQTLTAEQLAFVNNMHEYLDSYWPEIAAKERRVTGVEPQKVEAEPYQVQAADGQLVDMRGGYYPIKYDAERSSRSEADEVAEAVTAALRGTYTRATTRRGHTKARVDKVERPVRKDLLVPFGHVNQVIHDLSFHEYLIDANRLIASPQIDAAIRDHYGVETLRTIKKTLQDIAEGETVAENSLERAVNYVRTGTTIVGLGWSLTTGLLQPLGLTQSIVRIGPKYVAKGIGKTFADAVSLQNTLEAITAESDFMRLRAKTMMREISEVQNTVKASIKPAAWGPVEATFFALIQKLQLIADVPTYLGAKAKAEAQGHDTAEAIAIAEQAVRDSQGSGQTGDLAQIQRGSVWLKLWTNFYSFFNVTYNQMAESVAETRRVGASRLPLLAADVLMLAIVPAVLGEILKHALRGDDWDWDKLGPELAKAQLSYLLGFMVGLRELGMVGDLGLAAAGKPTVTTNNGRGPAALRLLTSDLPALVQQVSQGEADDAFRTALLNTSGILFHFPAGQINRTIDGIEALAKGDTKNPMAVLVGPPHKH